MKDLSAIEAQAKIISDAQAVIEAARTKRTKLVIAARRDGYPWAKISEAANVARQGLMDQATQANGGVLPTPRQQA